jgi:pimeloyl-ACP methyl ester carboxylesterase
MRFFRSPKAERVLSENGYARLLGAFADLDDESRKALIEAWSQPGALTGGLNYYRASPMVPPSADDPGAKKLQLKPEDFIVKVPTLVVWGERDTALLPGCIDGLEAVVPDLKLVRVPEASHWIARERTSRVIGEIEAFTIKR